MGSTNSAGNADRREESANKTLPVKKRGIDTSRRASSELDDGSSSIRSTWEEKTKNNKKGRKIIKNKNVYQQPLKSLKKFSPKFISKAPEESEQIRAALGKNFVFSDLDKSALAPLVDAFELCSFRSGETIIKQGDPGQSID
jgi:hypothetical protein